jgi:hypothetical protein
MALKFRRGTTAQQSGSLAFGEPFVNTTLGTLLVGGATGDITLAVAGTGSTGTFGAISGSGLDITGNANIAGNLTLGGAITIGDATADTVNVVASLSSSLIPQTTNAFDLGSATKIWRDLYISTGSIKFVEGTSVVKSLSAATLTALEAATGSANVSVAALNSFSSSQLTQNTALATISGSLILTASANTVSVANLNTTTASLLIETANLESFTSSINTTIKTQLDSNTVVSGSSQISYASISSIPAGIVSGAAQVTPLLPTGTISGSSQLSGTSITDLTIINLTTVNQTASVVFSSGSNRFGDAGNDTHSFTGSVQISGSLTTIGASTATSFNGAINSTNGVVSGSSQITGLSNAQLTNSTISGKALGTNLDTLTIGTGLSGTSYNGSGAVTIANTGVTSITGTANQVIASAGTGGVTLSLPQSIHSTATPTFGNLTISGTITATGDITAFFTSDKRHKNTIQTISNAVLKVKQLNGVTWEWNDDVNEVTKSTPKTGLIAQEVQQVLPQVVIERADGFLALDYSKMVGLLVEAIKEQQIQIDQLKAQIGSK